MEYYEVAAKWWAHKLREMAVENFSIGEGGTIGYIAQLLGYMIAKDSEPTEDVINAFESILAQSLKRDIEQFKHSITLEVDYHPVGYLCHVANKAKLDLNCLPKRVIMEVSKDEVSVKVGGKYNSHYLVIYQSAEYAERMDIL